MNCKTDRLEFAVGDVGGPLLCACHAPEAGLCCPLDEVPDRVSRRVGPATHIQDGEFDTRLAIVGRGETTGNPSPCGGDTWRAGDLRADCLIQRDQVFCFCIRNAHENTPVKVDEPIH